MHSPVPTQGVPPQDSSSTMDLLHDTFNWLRSLGRFVSTLAIYVVRCPVQCDTAARECSTPVPECTYTFLTLQVIKGLPMQAFSLLPVFPILFIPNPILLATDKLIKMLMSPIFGTPPLARKTRQRSALRHQGYKSERENGYSVSAISGRLPFEG